MFNRKHRPRDHVSSQHCYVKYKNVILANFDIIFRGEGVEIAKIGGKWGKREFQELFKYQIGFYVALMVAEILAVKETTF